MLCWWSTSPAFLLGPTEDKQEDTAASPSGEPTAVTGPASPWSTNASTAEIYGLEVDTQWLPAPGLSIVPTLACSTPSTTNFEFLGPAGLQDLSHLEIAGA